MNLKKLALGTAIVGLSLTSCQDKNKSSDQRNLDAVNAELVERELAERNNSDQVKNLTDLTASDSLSIVKDSLNNQIKEIDDKLKDQKQELNEVEKLALEYGLEDGGAINQEVVKGVEVSLDRNGRVRKFPKSIRTSIHNPENRSETRTVKINILNYRVEREAIDNGIQSACTSCPQYQYKVIAVGQIKWPFSGNSEKLASVQLSAYAPMDGCKKKMDFDMIGQTNSAVLVRHEGDFKNGELSTFGKQSPLSNDGDYTSVDFCPSGDCADLKNNVERSTRLRSNIQILETERKEVVHKKEVLETEILIKDVLAEGKNEPCEEAVVLKLKADTLNNQIEQNNLIIEEGKKKIEELENTIEQNDSIAINNPQVQEALKSNEDKIKKLEDELKAAELENSKLIEQRNQAESKFLMFGSKLRKEREAAEAAKETQE